MLCEVVADGMVVEMPVVIGVVVESAFTRSQVMVGEVTPDAEQENCNSSTSEQILGMVCYGWSCTRHRYNYD